MKEKRVKGGMAWKQVTSMKVKEKKDIGEDAVKRGRGGKGWIIRDMY